MKYEIGDLLLYGDRQNGQGSTIAQIKDINGDGTATVTQYYIDWHKNVEQTTEFHWLLEPPYDDLISVLNQASIERLQSL